MLLASTVIMSACSQNLNESPVLDGPYIGQMPPGLMPEVFAPGVVSTKGWEFGGTFTPDMNEFYFLRQVEADGNSNQEFVLFQYKDNRWEESVLGPRIGAPSFSQDGKIMHLGSRYKERTKDGWSERQSLGAPFNEIPIMRLTASSRGTYFFDEFKSDFTGSISYSRIVDGKYEEPKLLSKKINGGKSFHPFIAPDESYLIWDGQIENGPRNSDLYINFRQQDGSWGDTINMGDKINTDAWEAGATVTPDGKYLFFNRNMGSDKYENVDIFWVDAQIIEDLRPGH